MAAINEVDFSRASILGDQSFIRELVAEAFWKWYMMNTHVRITTIRIWFIRKDVFVGDLESLFALLFGPPPR